MKNSICDVSWQSPENLNQQLWLCKVTVWEKLSCRLCSRHLASLDHKIQPLSLVHNITRDHPPDGYDVCSLPLSVWNVENLLHERGMDVCHETVRFWRNRFGPLGASANAHKRFLPEYKIQNILVNTRLHLDSLPSFSQLHEKFFSLFPLETDLFFAIFEWSSEWTTERNQMNPSNTVSVVTLIEEIESEWIRENQPPSECAWSCYYIGPLSLKLLQKGLQMVPRLNS
jgi:hypothetical protein